jgi:hypothetical protein
MMIAQQRASVASRLVWLGPRVYVRLADQIGKYQ